MLSVYGCGRSESQEAFYKRLMSIDNMIESSPEAAMDSLKAINRSEFSGLNSGYYGLLETITKDKNHILFDNDSTITAVVAWYSKSKDSYNYTRALLYNGIVKHRINEQDTLAYTLIKEAEKIADINNVKNRPLRAMIYSYLGIINGLKKNFQEAIAYYNLSASYYKDMGNLDNYVIVMCDIVWAEMAMGRAEEAIKVIDSMSMIDSLSLNTKLCIYNAYAGYYSLIGDYRAALNYTKKRIISSNNAEIMNGLVYSISRYYINLNMLDSALVYCQMLDRLLETKENNTEEEAYYRHISNVYKLAGNNEKGFDFLVKAYMSLRRSTSERSAKRVLELEKQYDLSEKDLQLERERNKIIIQQWVMLMLITITIFGSLVISMRIRLNKKELQMVEARMRNKDLINELLKISSKTLPNMLDEISSLSESLRSRSDRLSNEFKYALNRLKMRYRDEIYSFVEDKFSKIETPKIKQDEFLQLNSTEKLVLFLLYQDYTIKEVAHILNTTESSVRAQKSRLKKYFL
jgi:hypothetical protein